MEKLLIIGALGHIGSYLLNNLKGYDITAVDNFATQRYCSLFNPKQKFDFREADFYRLTIEFLEYFDAVVHLAAKTDAAASFDAKADFFKENTDKASEFFGKCGDAGLRVIFPSTTSIYGTADAIVREDAIPNPQSPYAESKLAAEKELWKFCPEAIVLRFGTICGVSQGMRFHTAVNKFCWQAVMGETLTVWEENYDHHRPYLSLPDAMEAIDMAIRGTFHRDTYNILSANITTKRIIDHIQYILGGWALGIDMIASPLVNQHTYKVDISKAQKRGFKGGGESGIFNCIEETITTLKV